MKESETKERFIVLKAKGKSYKTISRELNVSKTTLLKWGRVYQEEIATLKAIELEALREKYWLTTQAQVEFYGAERLRIRKELETRDLSTVPTPKLYDVLTKFDAQIEARCPEKEISDEDTMADQKELRRLLLHEATETEQLP